MMFCLQRSLVFMARKKYYSKATHFSPVLPFIYKPVMQSKINYGFLYETQHWVEIG